jgi:AraC-like DNA-binding protein
VAESDYVAGAMGTWTLIAPPAALNSVVRFFWILDPMTAGVFEAIPDGCVDVGLVLLPRRPRIEIYGTPTRKAFLEMEPGCTHVGFRLQPGFARRLLADPIKEYTDRVIRTDELWGHSATELADRRSHEEIVAGLAKLLAANLRGQPFSAVESALEAIHGSYGTIRMGHLAKTSGKTLRSLERLFADEVGVSPKFYARIHRLRTLIYRLRRTNSGDWSDLAFNLAYADQAHLIRDVNELTGYTPTTLAHLAKEKPLGWV